MKLYSGPVSLFSAKVRVVLAEKGLPFELVTVPFDRKSGYTPTHPEVLARNPKAQVPVLVDADVCVYDSTLILEYLEERYPDPPLYPRTVEGRARCRQFEAASDEILFPFVWDLIEEIFYTEDSARRNADRIQTAQAGIRRIYIGLDLNLKGREYLCDELTVADIAYFLTVGFASNFGTPPGPDLKHLAAWLARVGARPTIQSEMAEMTAFAANL